MKRARPRNPIAGNRLLRSSRHDTAHSQTAARCRCCASYGRRAAHNARSHEACPRAPSPLSADGRSRSSVIRRKLPVPWRISRAPCLLMKWKRPFKASGGRALSSRKSDPAGDQTPISHERGFAAIRFSEFMTSGISGIRKVRKSRSRNNIRSRLREINKQYYFLIL